ncbi:uncharacterized protein A4U43_UnF6970 [Asparagus officinalis]|uniref:Uncharacterized protein n=1 Tax=Asparagus officinalis TaxID=4686 RepID=A0A1R3L6D3_ASPOF|nr:uncharacterized protein A4U43_UnF6970 [Asparagus officinalis]
MGVSLLREAGDEGVPGDGGSARHFVEQLASEVEGAGRGVGVEHGGGDIWVECGGLMLCMLQSDWRAERYEAENEGGEGGGRPGGVGPDEASEGEREGRLRWRWEWAGRPRERGGGPVEGEGRKGCRAGVKGSSARGGRRYEWRREDFRLRLRLLRAGAGGGVGGRHEEVGIARLSKRLTLGIAA